MASRLDKKDTEAFCKKYGISPSKKMGQNFLIDRQALEKMIKAAGLRAKDTVLEIGPGTGIITQEIARKVRKVIAVERDQKLMLLLRESLSDFSNVEIIQGDILEIKRLKIINYKIVANLPFYLASPAIRHFLERFDPQPRTMVLIVQKEVGQRITAQAPQMNLLAVSIQFYAKAEIISFVPKKSFWPQPKVDSAIIKITPRKLSTKPGNVDLFFKIIRAGFSHPRKQILNNLAEKLNLGRKNVENWLSENGVQRTQRAETLSIKNWVKLTETF